RRHGETPALAHGTGRRAVRRRAGGAPPPGSRRSRLLRGRDEDPPATGARPAEEGRSRGDFQPLPQLPPLRGARLRRRADSRDGLVHGRRLSGVGEASPERRSTPRRPTALGRPGLAAIAPGLYLDALRAENVWRDSV